MIDLLRGTVLSFGREHPTSSSPARGGGWKEGEPARSDDREEYPLRWRYMPRPPGSLQSNPPCVMAELVMLA